MRRHLTSAHVIALLALFVALGGSATAAVLVTGADVRDGSLTGAAVRDGTLLPRDLQPQSSFAARGGSQAVGPTDRVLVSVDVPAGTFLVSADAELVALQPGVDQIGQCTLASPETQIARKRARATSGVIEQEDGQRSSGPTLLPLMAIAATRGGRISLSCRRVAGGSTLLVSSFSLHAVPVPALRE